MSTAGTYQQLRPLMFAIAYRMLGEVALVSPGGGQGAGLASGA